MYQPFVLSGKGILITGGNAGIGLGMARALLMAGATVAIWGSDAEKNERAKQQLAAECSAPDRINAFTCDIRDETAVEHAFARTVEKAGRIDACFANAGISGKGTRLLDMTLEDFRRIQRVNVEGVFLTLRAAARHMVEHGGGSLVATGSTAAVEGAARNSHYGASKGAVTSMVRALAVELARHRIRVNSILPGWVETDMTQRSFTDDKFASAVMPRIPARRWGNIDDFGGIAIYLASEASSYTSGEQFLIDGAYTKF